MQPSANPWLGRRVLTYAHQCGAWEAPSSTLYALRRALDLGATGIELDDTPLAWAKDGGSVLVAHENRDMTTTVHRVELASGKRTALRVLAPADRAGIKPGLIILTANGKPVLHPNQLAEVVERLLRIAAAVA